MVLCELEKAFPEIRGIAFADDLAIRMKINPSTMKDIINIFEEFELTINTQITISFYINVGCAIK